MIFPGLLEDALNTDLVLAGQCPESADTIRAAADYCDFRCCYLRRGGGDFRDEL